MLPHDYCLLTHDQVKTLTTFFSDLGKDKKLKHLLNFYDLPELIRELDLYIKYRDKMQYFDPSDYELRKDD